MVRFFKRQIKQIQKGGSKVLLGKINKIPYYIFGNGLRINSAIAYQINYLISIFVYLIREKDIFIIKNRLKESVWLTRIDASEISSQIKNFKFSGPAPSRFFDKSDEYEVYNYPLEYLKQISFEDDFDRGSVSIWIEKNLGDLIRKNLCAQYQILHIWIYKTPAIDGKETYNLNSKFHYDDGDRPGAIKMLVYLSDVDENGGPFQYKLNDKKYTVVGDAGETIFFKRYLFHAGSNVKDKDRYVMSVLCYPTIAKRPVFLTSKKVPPFNALYRNNPFK